MVVFFCLECFDDLENIALADFDPIDISGASVVAGGASVVVPMDISGASVVVGSGGASVVVAVATVVVVVATGQKASEAGTSSSFKVEMEQYSMTKLAKGNDSEAYLKSHYEYL